MVRRTSFLGAFHLGLTGIVALQAQIKVPTPHHARAFLDFVNASPSPFHAVGAL